MKDNWEKLTSNISLSIDEIRDIISGFNSSLTLSSVERLSGGLSHTNYKMTFKNDPDPLVLRLTDNKENLQMEHVLHKRLLSTTSIPVPTFFYVAQWKNYGVGLLEWRHGESLNKRLFNCSSKDIYSLAHAAGHYLAAFRTITFEQHGFLDEHLNIYEKFQLTPEAYPDLISYFIEGKASQWLGDGLPTEIYRFTDHYAPIFSEDTSGPALVHGDYNALNLLADNQGITAVLDWEFALSGSIYLDIGNMLRYQSLPHYSTFEKGFIDGITSVGFQLSKDWRKLAALSDLISLLSMLDNDLGGPNRVKDINRLIRFTLNNFE